MDQLTALKYEGLRDLVAECMGHGLAKPVPVDRADWFIGMLYARGFQIVEKS